MTGLQHYLHDLSCSQKVKLKWLPGSTFGNWQGTSDLRVGKVFRRQEHKQIRIQHAWCGPLIVDDVDAFGLNLPIGRYIHIHITPTVDLDDSCNSLGRFKLPS